MILITKNKNYIILVVICIIISFYVQAQKTQVYTDKLNIYKKALELFEKQKYSSAIRLFEDVLENEPNLNSEVTSNAQFFRAICALELFNKDTEYHFKNFIKLYPESPKITTAYFLLGRYNYRKRNWKEVLHWYSFIDDYALNDEDKSEFIFRTAYSLLQLQNYDLAFEKFFSLKDIDSYYKTASIYYYGYIAYIKENYETALQSFRSIEKDPKFNSIIPFYISQILYQQKKYEELLKYSLPKLQVMKKSKQLDKMSRLVADAYYHKKEYEKVIPYFETYKEKNENYTRNDKYQLGYCYFKTKKYEKAIKEFSPIINKKDEISQTSAYHIAYCYIALNNKKAAQEAFKKTTEINIDKDLTEEAFYNYAKLTYELAFDPYNESLKEFLLFLEKFPNSKRKNEIYEYMIRIYLNSKNYPSAIKSLKKIKDKNIKFKECYQKLLFNEGINLYNVGKFNKSIKCFETSINNSEFQKLKIEAIYWIGESFYKLSQYDSAIKYFNNFIYLPQAILSDLFQISHYNIGYSYFKTKQYKKAITWFRKYINFSNNNEELKICDANIRIADCYFISKEYKMSLEYYQNAIITKLITPDYVYYQYALANSILKNTNIKIQTLQKLEREFPNSSYLEAAQFELGKTYMYQEKNELAITYFTKIIKKNKISSYRKKALLNLATIKYNDGNEKKSLEYFQTVVSENPTYEGSKEALTGIETIYINRGDIDSYEKYIKQLSFMDITNGALDSLIFKTAEKFYLYEKFEESIEKFKTYLNKFKNPIFKLSATYYIANASYLINDSITALLYYNNILALPYNQYTENSLLHTIYIHVQNKDYNLALMDQKILYEIAEKNKNKLFAIKGIVDILYKTKNYDSLIVYSKYLLETPNLDSNTIMSTLLKRANSYYFLAIRDSLFSKYKKTKIEIDNFQINKDSTNNNKTVDSTTIVRSIENDEITDENNGYLINKEKKEEINDSNKIKFKNKITLPPISESYIGKAEKLFILILNKSTSNDIKTAEAQYKIAKIKFLLYELNSAENEVFKLINQTPSYEKWISKTLILLSEIYLSKKDYFQAKTTLESVINNYSKKDEIWDEAKEKLNLVIKMEKIKETNESVKDIEIKMGNDIYDNFIE